MAFGAIVFAAALAFSGGGASRPPLFVHVMPWFEAAEDRWGWHWTMNRDAAELRRSGRVASHYRPLIGAYDSLDPDVLELQVAWIKLAGFDGVLADWYGLLPHYDYPGIHRRTEALFEVAGRAGLKIGVVFEDQTAGNAVRGGLLAPESVRESARETGTFLKRWFGRPNWWRVRGKPVVMVFGPQAYGADDWAAFRDGAGPFNLLTLHDVRPYAQGGFDWPVPTKGTRYNREFAVRAKDWAIRVPVAYPRFHDYYEEGGQTGHPDLPDEDGATYRRTLAEALAARCDAVQVATWNDWQEGTQIEPSVEFRYRDLIATQAARRRADRSFRFTAADLELPERLYRLRKGSGDRSRLRPIGEALLRGDVARARTLLKTFRAG
ncbi:MAG: hypothetical protein KIS66_09165 [Fimbriimonadaceae bacterium]|nr:hypothetical protein [Fimbriimonadaceae bacterium]